jgi:hypothetical protein
MLGQEHDYGCHGTDQKKAGQYKVGEGHESQPDNDQAEQDGRETSDEQLRGQIVRAKR